MEKYKKIETGIWELSDVLRHVMYVRNIPYTLTRLVFLKYAIDNYIGAVGVEEMQQCAKAQKMLAMRDVDNGLSAIIPVLEYIDKAYGLERIVSSSENILEYETALFGVDRSLKKNVTSSNFRDVIEVLARLDLAEDDEKKVGDMLVEQLMSIIMADSLRSTARDNSTTSIQLSDIVKGILAVKPEDTFCDFLSGVGVSTLRINENTSSKVITSDIDISMVAISAMLYIMKGFHNFSVFQEDSLVKINMNIAGNRIFVDPPLGLRIKNGYPDEYSDVALRVIDRIMKYHLSENGVAVIAVPSGVLFGSGPAKKLKKNLVDNQNLKAVISLPPMWSGTVVGTNLIVVTRNANKEILFMDAFSDRKSSRRKSAILTVDEIDKIVKTYNVPIDEVGFSKVVSKKMIEENDYSLVPKNYIEAVNEEETYSVEEIDKELEKLYASLKG